MKFSMPAAELAAAVSRIRPMASNKGDVAATCRLSTSGGSIALAAADGEIVISTVADVNDHEDGVVFVPTKLLCDAVPHFTGEVHVSTDENSLILTDSSGPMVLTCEKDAAPHLDSWPSGEPVSLSASQFSNAVRSVEKAVSKSRLELTGVHFDQDGNDHLRLVATNSYCLAVADTKLSSVGDPFTVPLDALKTALKVLDQTGDIDVRVTKSSVGLTDGVTKVTVPVLGHQFPAYNVLLRSDFNVKAKLNGPVAAAALSRVSVVLAQGQAVLVEAKDGELLMSAPQAAAGAANMSVDAVVEGEDLHVSLNPEYVNLALGSLGSDITLSWRNANEPALFQNGTTFWYVMPTRSSS